MREPFFIGDLMNFTLATKTLQSIEEFIEKDQGAKYRGFLQKVMPHIGDAYRSEEEVGFRSHLGASLIGRECGRELWYGFRWTMKARFSGRMNRLFNRGHMEEGRFIAILLTIGCEVFQQDANGKQFRISEYGGHFGGSGDGVVVGLPDLPPGVPALSEFKTHNDKSFAKLVKEGVRAAKFEHWIQMQVYMRKMGLAVAVYFAVNKNDDHIHAELVYLDSAKADEAIHRAGKIIMMQQAPDKLSKSPTFFGCNFCNFKPICKQGAPVERNCRTCMYAEPRIDGPMAGQWMCENKGRQLELLFPDTNPLKETFALTKERQLMACERYVKNPSM